MTTRSHYATFVAATVVLVVFASWLAFGWGGPSVVTVVGDVGSSVGGAFAASCAIAGARSRSGRLRVALLCLAVGLLGWVLSDLIWVVRDTVSAGATFLPGWIDLGYFLLPIGVCVGALFAPDGGLHLSLRIILDGVLVATTLFIVAWTTFLRELFVLGSASSTSFNVSVAYPFADAAMVTSVLLVLVQSPPGRRLPLSLFAVGLALIGLSDSAYVFAAAHGDQPSPLVMFGWTTGLYVVGLGGLAVLGLPGKRRALKRKRPRAIYWVPYVPVPLAVALGSRELLTRDSVPLIAAGIVLIAVAFARQFLLLDENRRLLQTVTDMALRDPLTGLANRALFVDRVGHAIQLRNRTGAPVCVLLADLDDFKLVNDSLGHPVGDELLCSVGDRIQNVIRPGDTVARLGGDEFAILVEDEPSVAEQIAARVARAFDEPFMIDDSSIDMRLSIGLATAVGDADVSAEELFKSADLAMYSAKRAHAGSRSFTPDMRQDATELTLTSPRNRTGHQEGVARIQFLADLRRAVDDCELDLVYQPKVSLLTGCAVGVEALLRWPHPEFGLLEPADFLSLIFEHGLIETVTDFVLDRAIRDAVAWHAVGVKLPVAVNLSAPSLTDVALPARVLSTVDRHGLPPTSLTVEITEDMLLSGVVCARNVLDQLRQSGVRVAIDDFGSGYAAMTYLHELPADELKLDRQFISPILHDERAASIVVSVINLANEFGLTCVAEGIEDEATAKLLKSYGCGYAQGHFFSPPVPAGAIRAGLRLTTVGAIRPSWA